MKLNLTSIAVFIAAIVFLSLGIFTYVLYRENKKLADREPQTVIQKSVQQQIVKQYTDRLGQNHTTFMTPVALTSDEIKKGAVNKPLIDTIARALNIKSNEVKFWQEAALSSQAKNLKASKTIDSLQRVVYRYNNNFINVAYHIPSASDTLNPDGVFDYKYNAKISTVQYTKRRKVLGLPLGSKESFTDLYSDDPNATINGFRSFSVKQKEPTYGLRLQASGTYSFNKANFAPGLGAQFDFGRLSLRGVHYFNSASVSEATKAGLKQNNVATLSYDFLKF